MKAIPILIALLSMTIGSIGQVKKPEPPAKKAAFDSSLQIVVVVTDDWEKTTGFASIYERRTPKSEWKRNGDRFPIVVGRSGLALAEAFEQKDQPSKKLKQEGDGNAPAGLFPLTSAFGTGSKPNAVEMPYTKLDENTECVDDSNSTFYNRIVNRMRIGNFDWQSSEKMASIVPEYDLGVFVAYNTYPVEKGRGSCIFLHVWKDAETPTAGCTAMERRNMELVLGWLSPAKNPYLVQMPKKVYDSRRKAWKLPKLN